MNHIENQALNDIEKACIKAYGNLKGQATFTTIFRNLPEKYRTV